MAWSWRIATLFGIGIYVHFTFLLLLAWFGYMEIADGGTLADAAVAIGFISALFGCVVLHELGHALTARRFGIPTRDITLLPIGGVARLERIPEDPWQEFWIAVAGPAVNVVIAITVAVVVVSAGHLPNWEDANSVAKFFEKSFWFKLMFINIMLVLFNMLPAFPMDGGRVLRALLATQLSRIRATRIAATVGQLMAILFGVAGIFMGQWMLLFIAFFVFLGAQAEARAVELRSIFRGVTVREAMATRFVTLDAADPIQRAVDELLSGHQQDFPVVSASKVVGIAMRGDILRVIRDEDMSPTVGDALCTQCPIVSAADRLDQVTEAMQSAGCSSALVTENGQLVGLLTSENVGEWSMVQAALRDRK